MNKIKNTLQIALYFLLDILGINAICRWLNRNKAIILWYHGIHDENFDLLQGINDKHIPESAFRKHLEYLKRWGYIFVSMTELIDALKNKRKVSKHVVLTFDDGFKNVVENAYLKMKAFNAKGCFYLVSDLIGTDELLWTDFVETVIINQNKGDFQFIFKGKTINYKLSDKVSYKHAIKDIKAKLRMLPDGERLEHLKQFSNYKLTNIPKEFAMPRWEQIKELDPDILEIGGHTRRHPNCTNLTTDDELEDEIYNSKIDIERKIGRKVDHFCYPAGSYNDKVISMVKKYGYKSAVTIENGFNDENSDLYRLKRTGVNEQLFFFKASVSGSYYLLRRIKAVLS